MKRFKLLYGMLLAVVAALSGLLIACGNKTEAPVVTEGPEIGVYYYDADDGEYLVTLGKGATATLVMTDNNYVGSYTISGAKLELNLDIGKYNATLNDDILAVDMGDGRGVWNFTKRIVYTVSFDTGAGTAVSSVRVINGKTVTRPADPVNGNMVFIGWYTDREYTSPFVFGANPVKSDITLYARWVEPVFGRAEYEIKFDLDYDGAPAVAAKQTVGGKLYNVVTPTREGYNFAGWWVKAYSADRKTKALSYRLEADTVFSASTTLYALWQSNEVTAKLAQPVVDVRAGGISWGSNANASAYKVLVTGPDGSEVRKDDSYGPTSMDIDFSALAEGKYVISVTAVAASGDASNNSDPAIRYYDNKTLAPVSLFTVVEPSTLIYNAVEGAEKYLIDVKCGDEYHKHTQIDNGNSTSYNFINCMMKSEGIEFTVTAVAAGKASSVSETYYYTRPLGDVTGLRYNQAEETVAWNSVKGAAGYTVELSCENNQHSHNVTVDVGNTTHMSVKTYEGCNGTITVKVTPYTNGYNSPAPAELAIQKTSLAAPSNVRIVGEVLSWDGDAAATGYDVYIASQTVSTATNSLDLSTVEGISWEANGDYQIRVLAKNADKTSLWSDTVDARYYALYSSLTYNAGVVSWRRVIGAVKYNVRVNDGTAVEVTDGTNSLPVTLTQAGENTIYVNFVDGANKASSWAQIKVKAEAVTFDLRGGEGDAPTQYYALGDRVQLPDGTGFARTGYTFAGWYTSPYGADGFGARYTDTYFGNIGGLVLYANWSPKTYDITFENGDLPAGSEKGKVTYRRPFQWPIPTNDDTSLVFAGWYSDSEGLEVRYTDETGKSISDWGISRNMTVYACWNSIFSFEKLTNGTYRISKNTQYWTQHAPADLTIPATYREPGTTRYIKVTEIGSASFTSSTMLKTVRIPNSIKYVDTNGFNSSTNIEQFIVYDVEGTVLPEYSSHEGVLYHDVLDDFGNITSKALWIYPRGKADAEYKIQAGTTVLPYRSLYYAKATKIIIPTSVVRIEGQAIYLCSSLTDIEFEDGGEVTEDSNVKALVIENQAFYSLSKLERIKIPARLSSFNPEMIVSCNSFKTIEVEANSKKYGAVDGFLTDAAKTTILYCPIKAVVGKLELPTGITIIGERAFVSNTQITSVELPYYAVEIRDYAFNKCTNLTTVSFKSDVVDPFDMKIGAHAFEGCTKLATFDSSNGNVVEIGEYAFAGCNALTKFEIPETLTKLGEYAFNKCTGLTEIFIPATLAEVEQYAFAGCTKLDTIKFGELKDGKTAALAIGDFAFNGCTALIEIDLPEYVCEIGEAVFGGCTKLAEITVDENNEHFETYLGVLFTKGFEEMLFYPLGRTGEFTLPDQVKVLSAQLFKGNTSLTAIVIGKNVKSIGDEAFMNCTALTTVTFENESAIELGEKVFEGCTGLTTVTLNDYITKIPDRMFYNDKAITEIVMPQYVTEIGDYAFYYLEKIEEITIPATVHRIGYGAFYYCKALDKVTFDEPPANVDEDSDIDYATTLNFGRYADVTTSSTNDQSTNIFANCGITEINIPARMTEIPHAMFLSCTLLEEINIPNTVNKIGAKAFSGCTSLQRVIFEGGNLANTLTVYDTCTTSNPTASSGAFYNCSQLYSINLPERIETIPQFMFYNCRGLTSITIPKSVKNKTNDNGEITVYAIQNSAFYNCMGLVTVTFAEDNTNEITIGPSAFYSCSKLQTVNLPKGLTYIKKFDDNGNDISDYYDVFAADAFTYCSALNAINIKEGGKYYTDDGIIYYHDVITDEDGEVTDEIREVIICPQSRTKAVVIPYNVTSINARAFTTCYNITSFSFQPTPEGETEVDLKINDASNDADAVARKSGAFNWFIGITMLSLPDRLTYIGDYAFYDCSMLHTLTIGENSRLAHVGKYAFGKCSGLNIIRVPATVKEIGASAFDGCTRITEFTFADGSQLTKIGDRAFAQTNFTEIVIPNTVKTLGSALFDGSSLTTITLPSSLSELDVATFAGCDNIQSISLTGNTKYYIEDSVIYNAAKTELMLYPANKNAESYVVLEGVTTIDAGAFAGNTYLKSVTVPNTVETIGAGAFYGCTNLQTVYFTPDNANAAGKLDVGGTSDTQGVFQGCSSLKTVNLPERTTRLGLNAFADCANLTALTIHKDAQLQAINAGVFSNAGGGTLTLPVAVSTIGENAFTGSLFTQVVMTNVTTINKNAFNGSGIASVILPATVATIGESAFANCAELTSVEIKLNTNKNLSITTTTTTTQNDTNGLKGTFANCPKLKTAIIATNGVLPYHMFYKCNALEELTINGSGSIQGYLCGTGTTTTVYYPNTTTPGSTSSASVQIGIQGLKKVAIDNTITSIGSYAFVGCSNLGSHNPETCVDENCAGDSAHGFTIVDTGKDDALKTIGTYAFQSTAIKSFVIPSSVTSLGSYAFRFNTALTSVTIPTKSFAEIPTYEFFGCTSLSTVTFVDKGVNAERKLVTIASSAFFNCTSLKSFDLTGFTSLKDYAFEYSGLTSIVIPDTITSSTSDTMTYYIFANCKDLTSVTIPTNGSAFIGKCTFQNCTSLDTVTFTGDGSVLTTIGTQAFEGCTALTNIILPEGLTTINANAFLNSGIKNIKLSSTIETIASTAFLGCKQLNVTVADGNASFTVSSDMKSLLSKDGKTLVQYIGNDTQYTIPEGVEVIGDYAFQNCESLEKITFTDTVKSIGQYAFRYCTSLGELTLPDLETLGQYAFANSGVTEVTIAGLPDAVGNYLFSECENLETVTFTGGAKTIGQYMFNKDASLQTIVFANDIETIGINAFAACAQLGNFTIPASVKTINDGAFMDCTTITSVNIPATVESLGKGAFAGCTSLETVTFAQSSDKLVIISGTAATANSNTRGTFAFCTSLESINLSTRPIYNSATATTITVPNHMFNGCTALSTVTLHSNTAEIGSNSFQNCLSLGRVALPSNVTVINSYAFNNTALSVMTLPEGMLTIATYAFMDCKLLESITIPGTVKTINSAAFAGCELLETVTFEADDGVTGLGFAGGTTALSFAPTGSLTGRGVFGGCESLKSIDLSTRCKIYNSPTLTTVGYTNYVATYLFSDCTSLTSVTLPSGIVSIGTGSFFNTGLTSFTLDGTVNQIGNAAFANCSDLETVTVTPSDTKLGIAAGSNITTIGSLGAFYNCTSLKSIELGNRPHLYNTVTGTNKYVPAYLFYNCTSLQHVTLPDEITHIYGGAFYNCKSLEHIDLPTSLTEIYMEAFRGSGLVELNLPDTVTRIMQGAFRDCDKLESVHLSTALKLVPKYVFMDCTSLQSLYVPAGITYFGNACFAGCSALETITFEENASPLGFAQGLGPEGEDRGVFADCTSLTSVDLSPINVRRMWFTTYTMSYTTYNVGYSYTINSAMPEYMFHGCTNLESVVLSNVMWFGGGYSGDKTRDDQTFGGCVNLKNVTWPTDVDFRLGDSSFENCGFETLTLPSNLAGMGSDVFAGNKNLTKLIVEPNLVCTYVRGFADCENLVEVELPDSHTGIDYRAFQNCVKLTTINMPEKLEYLSSNALQNTALESVTIPAGVSVYSDVFADCKQLESVTIEGKLDNLGWNVFQNCTALTSVTLEEGFDDVMNYMFAGCTSLASITLPSTVEYISSHAFDGCTSLASIEIPASVGYIGEFAFAGCTSLTSIVIPETVTEIRDYAFDGWTSSQTINIETRTQAPDDWSEYWNYNSKQVDVTPEPEEPEEGEEPVAPDPVYETRPDGVIAANIVWGYTRP
ncbi:MAG: leucine-rich repeat protein [Clostridiales bacterium]|nr:leucine-rich repeat protein [Clostridiales bacterium]